MIADDESLRYDRIMNARTLANLNKSSSMLHILASCRTIYCEAHGRMFRDLDLIVPARTLSINKGHKYTDDAGVRFVFTNILAVDNYAFFLFRFNTQYLGYSTKNMITRMTIVSMHWGLLEWYEFSQIYNHR